MRRSYNTVDKRLHINRRWFAVSDAAARLWTLLKSQCDDAGLFHGSAVRVRNECYVGGDTENQMFIGADRVAHLLDELEAHHLIARYDGPDAQRYCWVIDHIHSGGKRIRRYPAPPAALVERIAAAGSVTLPANLFQPDRPVAGPDPDASSLPVAGAASRGRPPVAADRASEAPPVAAGRQSRDIASCDVDSPPVAGSKSESSTHSRLTSSQRHDFPPVPVPVPVPKPLTRKPVPVPLDRGVTPSMGEHRARKRDGDGTGFVGGISGRNGDGRRSSRERAFAAQIGGKPDDLFDDSFVDRVFHHAAKFGVVTASDAGCLAVFAAAEHAIAHGDPERSPFGLFVALLFGRGHITCDDEDSASRRIARFYRGESRRRLSALEESLEDR